MSEVKVTKLQYREVVCDNLVLKQETFNKSRWQLSFVGMSDVLCMASSQLRDLAAMIAKALEEE